MVAPDPIVADCELVSLMIATCAPKAAVPPAVPAYTWGVTLSVKLAPTDRLPGPLLLASTLAPEPMEASVTLAMSTMLTEAPKLDVPGDAPLPDERVRAHAVRGRQVQVAAGVHHRSVTDEGIGVDRACRGRRRQYAGDFGRFDIGTLRLGRSAQTGC